MKNNPLNTILTGVLATSLFLSIYYCWKFFVSTRELRALQTEIARYQQTHQVLNLLVTDTAEYSRRDPATFGPIFEIIGLKVNRTAGAGADPTNGGQKSAGK